MGRIGRVAALWAHDRHAVGVVQAPQIQRRVVLLPRAHHGQRAVGQPRQRAGRVHGQGLDGQLHQRILVQAAALQEQGPERIARKLAGAVGARCHHGRIRVGHRQQARAGQDGVAPQPVRIARAVAALVVLLHQLQPQRIGHAHGGQLFGAVHGVAAHLRGLLARQRTGLAVQLALQRQQRHIARQCRAGQRQARGRIQLQLGRCQLGQCGAQQLLHHQVGVLAVQVQRGQKRIGVLRAGVDHAACQALHHLRQHGLQRARLEMGVQALEC